MKRWVILGLPILVVVAGLSVSPQALRAVRGSEVSSLGQQLDGTWLLTVTRDMAPPGEPLTFPTTLTFLPGGAYVETPSFAANRTTPGHGQWVRTGDREFRGSFLHFRTNPAGGYIGMTKVTQTLRLSEDLQELHSTAVIQVLDAEGTVLGRAHATSVGRRMSIGEVPDQP